MNESTVDYRSPEWVAEQLGIDKNTVYKYLQDGVIPALQLGRKWLISERDLISWLAEETRRQTQARRESADSAQRTSKKLGNMDARAKQAVKEAHSEARRYNHLKLGQGHLLIALAEDDEINNLLNSKHVDIEAFRQELEAELPTGDGTPSRRLGRTKDAKAAMKCASDYARLHGRQQLTCLDLLYGLAATTEGVATKYLKKHGVMPQDIKESVK